MPGAASKGSSSGTNPPMCTAMGNFEGAGKANIEAPSFSSSNACPGAGNASGAEAGAAASRSGNARVSVPDFNVERPPLGCALAMRNVPVASKWRGPTSAVRCPIITRRSPCPEGLPSGAGKLNDKSKLQNTCSNKTVRFSGSNNSCSSSFSTFCKVLSWSLNDKYKPRERSCVTTSKLLTWKAASGASGSSKIHTSASEPPTFLEAQSKQYLRSSAKYSLAASCDRTCGATGMVICAQPPIAGAVLSRPRSAMAANWSREGGTKPTAEESTANAKDHSPALSSTRPHCCTSSLASERRAPASRTSVKRRSSARNTSSDVSKDAQRRQEPTS
mmetsp:Transcript_4747/g.11786  ORF Transcript_4747/g.11786 Transcript_4747/m.11786 type:complete len:332 (-) Transcript_4747:1178-2173(-)